MIFTYLNLFLTTVSLAGIVQKLLILSLPIDDCETFCPLALVHGVLVTLPLDLKLHLIIRSLGSPTLIVALYVPGRLKTLY